MIRYIGEEENGHEPHYESPEAAFADLDRRVSGQGEAIENLRKRVAALESYANRQPWEPDWATAPEWVDVWVLEGVAGIGYYAYYGGHICGNGEVLAKREAIWCGPIPGWTEGAPVIRRRPREVTP